MYEVVAIITFLLCYFTSTSNSMQLCSLSLFTIKALVQTGASSVIFVVIAMCNANSVADVCVKLVKFGKELKQ